jgi:general secretion pathway protein H
MNVQLFSLKEKQKGFTLLELLLVLAIITLGSAIIIPNIGHTDGKLFAAQLRDLANVLKYNRRNAVVTGEIQSAQLFNLFDDQDNIKGHEQSYKMGYKKGQWHSQGAVIRWLDKDNIDNTKIYNTKVVQKQLETNILARQAMLMIQFFPQGGATGGTLLLQQGEQQAQLMVNSFNGRLSIQYPPKKR